MQACLLQVGDCPAGSLPGWPGMGRGIGSGASELVRLPGEGAHGGLALRRGAGGFLQVGVWMQGEA